MGKASSSKKVARAAGLGGSRAYGSRPPWNYYLAVFVLVVLGIVGVYNSREYRENQINKQGNTAPTVGTNWFEGLAIDECGKILSPIKTNKGSNGIATRGDGIIYISPKVKSAAGHNATLAKFASAIGMTFNASELQTPGGRLYQTGDTCEGKAGQVYVMTWSSPQAPQSDGVLQDKKEIDGGTPPGPREDTCNPDCESGVLLENNWLVTIAFLPSPPKHQTPNIPQPSAAVIAKLTNLVATGGTTTTTVPLVPSTTANAGKATATTGATSSSTSTPEATSTATTTPTTAAKSGQTSTATSATTATTRAGAGPTTTGKTAKTTKAAARGEAPASAGLMART
ncbi:MAG TPA: hypothetical protein VK425_09295 [Acidimicrobiales bacterium]|nr:hypothetical protein [Acidimicrobiales bacterium]